MASPNYSRSEWASLSIQERIRAMNQVTGDEESLQQEKSQEEEEDQERLELQKRSSVVDIWRKREATSPITEKPKKQPNEAVSVPWPDEEDSKPKVAESPSRTPQKAQLTWRNLFKGRPAEEDKEADLTILPARSNDDDATVASVASHSKSVVDAWTKRENVLPDSPVTVEKTPTLDAETTPKRSSVVDIWSKRTVLTKSKPSPPPPPLKDALQSPMTPTLNRVEEEPDMAVVQEKPSQGEKLSPWRNLFKGRLGAPPKAESKEEDLIIFAEVDVAPHSKSILDIWTKKAPETADSPMTVEPEPLVDAEVTPKESSVVDIWSKRNVPTKTTAPPPKEAFADLAPVKEELSGVVKRPCKASVGEAAPKLQSVPKHVVNSHAEEVQAKSSAVNRWQPFAPVVDNPTEVGPSKLSEVDRWRPISPVADNNAEEEPKKSSVMNRWGPFPPNADHPSEEKPSKSSVSNRWQPFPQVVDNPVEEEPAKLSVVNRWQPHGSSPQAPKVPTKVSPIVSQAAEDLPSKSSVVNRWQPFSQVVDNAAEEEPAKSSVVKRWQPQGGSPQAPKVPTKVSPIVSQPAEDLPSKSSVVNRWQPFSPVVDNAAEEEPAKSSVANRWQPQGGSPQARKEPTKASPIISQPAEDLPSKSSVVNRWQPFLPGVVNAAEEEPAKSSVVNRWQPQGGSPQALKESTKGQQSVKDADDVAVSGAKESKQFHSVTNRWQPNRHGATPTLPKAPTKMSPVVSPYGKVQLRKVPTKTSPPVVCQSSVEMACNAVEPVSEETKRSNVTSRWQPQGVGSSPQLRKVSKSTAAMSEATGEAVESSDEATKVSVVDRFKPQGAKSVEQLRREVPKPMIRNPEGMEKTISDNSKSSIALDRYKPQVGGTDPAAWRRKTLSKAPDSEGKTESGEESKPQGGEAIPQLLLVPKPVTGAAIETAESTGEPKRSSVLDHYASGSKVVDHYKLQGSEVPLPAQRQMAPTKELSPVKSSVKPDSENAPDLVEEPKHSSVLHCYKPPGRATAPLGLQRKMPDNNCPPVVVQTMVGPAEETTDASVAGAVGRAQEEEGEWALLTIDSTGSLPFDETPPNVKKVLASVSTIQVVPTESFESSEEKISAIIETPVAIPAVPSRDRLAESSFMAKVQNSLDRYGKTPFQSGTSAFRAKDVGSGLYSSLNKQISRPRPPRSMKEFRAKDVGSGLYSSLNKPISRPRPPRSMKEFLKQHKMKGSEESSENPDTCWTTDESTNTKVSSLTGGTPYRIGAAPVSSPPRVDNGFQVLEEEEEKEEDEKSILCRPALAEDDVQIAPTDAYADTVLAAVVEDKPADTDKIPDTNDGMPIAPMEAYAEQVLADVVDDKSADTDKIPDANDGKPIAPSDILIAPVDAYAEHVLADVVDDKPAYTDKIPDANDGKQIAPNDILIAPYEAYTDTVLSAVVDENPADTDKIPDANDGMAIASKDADSDMTAPSSPSTDDDDKPLAPVDVNADIALAFAGEREKPDYESESRLITSSKAMNSQKQQPHRSKVMKSPEENLCGTKATTPEDQYNNPSRRSSRKRLLERRIGRTTPSVSSQGSRISPDGNPEDNSCLPSRAAKYMPSNGLPNEAKIQQAVPNQQKGESRDLARSRLSHRYNRARDSPFKPHSLTPVPSCDSDTLSFFGGASSGHSAAISGVTLRSSVTSPTSSLTNRASQRVVRRRRNKLTKAEEKLAARDLARRVVSQTIKEQPRPGIEEDDYSGADQASDTPRHEELFSEPTKVFENKKRDGLAGRYNTSSRFMESVQNMLHGVGLGGNTSFESETTEGSSQFRSVESTSDSEAWMRGRMRKSNSSVHHRVPSDSTDGELDYDGLSWRRSDVVADNFVSASASNLEALKSAYKAVSLHQIAIDLTEEVSTATSLNLQKIASELNDGMSAASESIRSSFGTPPRSPRKLKIPKSSSEKNCVDEEVAIEVEYLEDTDGEGDLNDDDIKSTGNLDSEIEAVIASTRKEVGKGIFENGISPAGEPSQESLPLDTSDRRTAYV